MASTDFRTKAAVLSQFDAMATPFFDVYEGKQKKFDFIDDDLEGAKTYLDDQLTAIEQFGSTALFKITYYRELSEKGKLMPENIRGSNTFKLNERESAMELPYWKQRNENPELKEIKEMLVQQQSQINALLQEPDEEDEKPEAVGAVAQLSGMLAGLLQQPEIQQAIAGKIVGFLDNILPSNKVKNMQQPAALGNVQTDDITIIQQALDKLFAAGMTAADFKKLADLTADPATFNIYLSMLRK